MTDSNAVTRTGGGYQDTKPFKFFAYVLGTLLALGVAIWSDGTISDSEWSQLLLAAVTAAVVWMTTNLPTFPRLKEISAVILTLANLGASWLTGNGVTNAEWFNLAVLGLAVVGVIVVPNPVANTGTPAGGLAK
jgi:hypothetical protein